MKEQTNMPKECELLLFHSTTKKNLQGIMKDGIKPGMKGGWCDQWDKKLEKEIPSSIEELKREKVFIEEYRKECQEYIFLSTDFHSLEHEMPEESDTILIICLPKKKVIIPSRKLGRYVPFEEWEEISNSVNEEYRQVLVKEIISPHYILGCLDVEGEREWGSDPGATRFRINKNGQP